MKKPDLTGRAAMLSVRIKFQAPNAKSQMVRIWILPALLNNWQDYGEDYRITSLDFTLAETAKPFRFLVKQNWETHETRYFGSTHTDYSP